MTVARLWSGDRYKGVDVTIRALPIIARAVPNVKYLVIGRGDDRPRLEALAYEMGVGDRPPAQSPNISRWARCGR